MACLTELHRTSQNAVGHYPGPWAEPVRSNAPRPTLPPFREILPATRIESSPIEAVQTPAGIRAPTLQTYYLPFRRADGEIVTMPFTMLKPDNEAIHSTTRRTVQGKTLTYTLNVKQQPERARACGAGARGGLFSRPGHDVNAQLTCK